MVCAPGSRASSITQYPSDTARVGPGTPNIGSLEMLTSNGLEETLNLVRSPSDSPAVDRSPLNSIPSTHKKANGLLDGPSSLSARCLKSASAASGNSALETKTTF